MPCPDCKHCEQDLCEKHILGLLRFEAREECPQIPYGSCPVGHCNHTCDSNSQKVCRDWHSRTRKAGTYRRPLDRDEFAEAKRAMVESWT